MMIARISYVKHAITAVKNVQQVQLVRHVIQHR